MPDAASHHSLKAFLAIALVTATLSCSRRSTQISYPRTWDRKTAASYLDAREAWWTQWVIASLDHDTFCVSCHTTLPYMLARPALHQALGEQKLSPNELKIIDDVIRRVRLGKQTVPYYAGEGYDGKTAQSRGTEAVLNAMVLANYDAQRGKLSDDTRMAFENMWAQQQSAGENAGTWSWLQFDHEPWEANDSNYYGAALAAMAVGTAPENYASTPEIQENLACLKNYLLAQRGAQSTMNRVFLLWASTRLPGLLAPDQQKAIIQEVLQKQRADGGWRLASIAWKWDGWTLRSLINMWIREAGGPVSGKSDGVATGLIVLVLQEAGLPPDNVQLQKGISWLLRNQTAEGTWPASSVNIRKHMSSKTRLFMTDAATAFAVLALSENRHTPNQLAAKDHPAEVATTR
jgi:squalene-hopene/tetraprenyl-beta-curcumene cyclase